MLVQVSLKHIKSGTRMGCEKCPVALALKDAGFKDVKVLASHRGEVNGKTVWFSRSVERFIERYDKKRTVEPFRFKFKLTPKAN